MTTVAVRHSMEKNGSLGAAGRNEAGVNEAVGIVNRSDVEEPCFLRSRREFKVYLRVASAGRDVALSAVGVQVGAGSAIQLLFRIVRIR